MYTLQNVKDMYTIELALNMLHYIGLEEYLRDNFVQTYDKDLNFIGYSRSCNHVVG